LIGGDCQAPDGLDVQRLHHNLLARHLCIKGELRDAGYVQDWISLLREDKRVIFTSSRPQAKQVGRRTIFVVTRKSRRMNDWIIASLKRGAILYTNA
jgi:hypothetical protein